MRKFSAICCMVAMFALLCNVQRAHATGWLLPSVSTGIVAGEPVSILAGSASTFNPYVIGTGVFVAGLVAGYIWWKNKPSSSTTVTGSSVNNPQTVQFIDLTTSNLTPMINEAPIKASLSTSTVQNAVNSNPSNYPNLNTQMVNNTGTDITGSSSTHPSSTYTVQYDDTVITSTTTAALNACNAKRDAMQSASNHQSGNTAVCTSVSTTDPIWWATFGFTGPFTSNNPQNDWGVYYAGANMIIDSHIVSEYQYFFFPKTSGKTQQVVKWGSINYSDPNVKADVDKVFSDYRTATTISDDTGSPQTLAGIQNDILNKNLSGSLANYNAASAALSNSPGDTTLQSNYNKALNNYNSALNAMGIAPMTGNTPGGTTTGGGGGLSFSDMVGAIKSALGLDSTPADPGAQSYDTNVTNPDKSSISGLFDYITANSPLLSLGSRFHITTTNASCKVGGDLYLTASGNAKLHGSLSKHLELDFCQWQDTFNWLGSMFVALAHCYSAFILLGRRENS